MQEGEVVEGAGEVCWRKSRKESPQVEKTKDKDMLSLLFEKLKVCDVYALLLFSLFRVCVCVFCVHVFVFAFL